MLWGLAVPVGEEKVHVVAVVLVAEGASAEDVRSKIAEVLDFPENPDYPGNPELPDYPILLK